MACEAADQVSFAGSSHDRLIQAQQSHNYRDHGKVVDAERFYVSRKIYHLRHDKKLYSSCSLTEDCQHAEAYMSLHEQLAVLTTQSLL